MSATPKLLLSPKEAAQLLSISERTLWTITKQGAIACIRIGAAKRYEVKELERFIASRARTAPSKICRTQDESNGQSD